MRTQDELAFLASVRDNPDDDTVRLAYADYLDGLDTVSVRCPDGCKYHKTAKIFVQYENAYGAEATRSLQYKTWFRCKTCNGGGSIPDTSNRDCAELIRVQCELTIIPVCGNAPVRINRHHFTNCKRAGELLCREYSLLAANAERWRRGPVCEKCSGTKLVPARWIAGMGGRAPESCPDCFGTGDAGGLMRTTANKVYNRQTGNPAGEWLHEISYHRGMKRVHCQAADVWEKVPRDPKLDLDDRLNYVPKPPTYRPTAWALAVCRHHPDMMEMWVDDLEPIALSRVVAWYNLDEHTTSSQGGRVPGPVWDLLEGEDKSTDWDGKMFYSMESARTALCRVVVRWVHSFVK